MSRKACDSSALPFDITFDLYITSQPSKPFTRRYDKLHVTLYVDRKRVDKGVYSALSATRPLEERTSS